ncbi:YSC84-related protein [Vibrio sp. YIC-376]|uniref:YSC84-related protein n=1 Tax=Vibrio sp. YIC-376 TaxID=3136162 RepID=UPI00402A9318
MKKPIVILTTLMLLASPAHADWDKISEKMSELGDAVAEGAQEAWDSTKTFSKQAWQDFMNWSEEAMNTAGEWTDASIEKSKEWIDIADKKIDELMKGDTPEEARQAVDLMADSTMFKLFNEKPEAKALYDQAYGYAVFDSRKLSLLFHTNSGSGVAVNKQTEKRTYMNMFGMGLALGAGGKFYQQVVLFENQKDFDTFVNEGWEASSEATALAGEEGEELSAHFNSGVAVYQLNSKGLLVDVNVSGSKYWVNEELTNSQ